MHKPRFFLSALVLIPFAIAGHAAASPLVHPLRENTNIGRSLDTNRVMTPGQYLTTDPTVSPAFADLQSDGNLCVYRGPGNNQGYLWGTGPHPGASGFYLELNRPGLGHANPNLQVIGFPASGYNTCYWSSDGNRNLGG
ncbi:hypothetical protein D7D52_26345 [Nocardia yunnanensis]|uniref:Bulb-type lectin domain-containing protein n=2 Tax=Nocardia yunnanensis TaxID=2382165 RepID=A0A386ZJF0_9NOCA|nr:hypothetical protein D7D52_26345 [Nocardia yunnanensis]